MTTNLIYAAILGAFAAVLTFMFLWIARLYIEPLYAATGLAFLVVFVIFYLDLQQSERDIEQARVIERSLAPGAQS